jgi:hypothetical protein
MFCGKCGAENKDGAAFCKECGASLSSSAGTKKTGPNKIVIVIAIVILLALVAGLVWYLVFRNTDETMNEEIDTEIVEESELDNTDTEIETPEIVEEPIQPEKATYAEGIHEYSLLMADCTWDEAKAMCQENGGHLVTFETDEEYQHVLSMIDSNRDNYYYIGGTCFEDKYYWIAPEGVNNSVSLESRGNWMQGEPSYTDGTNVEDKMGIFYYKKENRWVWNDVPNSVLDVVDSYRGSLGYICEYE